MLNYTAYVNSRKFHTNLFLHFIQKIQYVNRCFVPSFLMYIYSYIKIYNILSNLILPRNKLFLEGCRNINVPKYTSQKVQMKMCSPRRERQRKDFIFGVGESSNSSGGNPWSHPSPLDPCMTAEPYTWSVNYMY